MICDGCKHKRKGVDDWPCKWCTPDNRKFEQEMEMDDFVGLTSAFPWRLDQDNAAGLCVMDARGEIVYCEDWSNFPDEMGSGTREAIIMRARANARYMVACSENSRR